jgi:hypothetical protein
LAKVRHPANTRPMDTGTMPRCTNITQGTLFHAGPESTSRPREQRGGSKEREEHGHRTGHSGNECADRHDHHHVRTGRRLPDAVQVVDLVICD